MSRIADAGQRRQALDATQSFICEAPAGSGKTELLTQRYLTLLAKVRRPEEILAITFTRKASAEMHCRIINALKMAQTGPAPQSDHQMLTWKLAKQALIEDKNHNWRLTDNPNRLQISTFDSLCARLTRALPLDSLLGGVLDIAEHPELLYQSAVQQLLANIEDDLPWSPSLVRLITHFDNNLPRVERLLITMLAKRESWLPLLSKDGDINHIKSILESNLQSAVDDSLQRVSRSIPKRYHHELIELASFAAANLRILGKQSPIQACLDLDVNAQGLPRYDTVGREQWRGLQSLLLVKSGQWRKSVNKSCGFPIGKNQEEKQAFSSRKDQMLSLIEHLKLQPELRDALNEIQFLPAVLYADAEWLVLQAITDLLPILAALLKLEFKSNKKLDFTEISHRTQLALGNDQNPTDLALRLDLRIQHILVDEFQDTAITQHVLLKQLTRGWQAGDGRSLFFVGDAMQSIYSFRGSDVGLFLHSKENGLADIPLVPLKLTTNFRSQAGIVDWTNRVFTHAFPTQSDRSSGAVSYSAATSFENKLPGKAVSVTGFSNDTTDQDEARWITGIIRHSWIENASTSIALLVRNRNHAAHILPMLRHQEIPYAAINFEPLSEQTVVRDLVSLSEALLDPIHPIAWLAILRAPWCGLTLNDLEAISQWECDSLQPVLTVQKIQACLNGYQSHEGLFGTAYSKIIHAKRSVSADGKQRIERVLPILLSAIEQRQQLPLRQWIESVWIQLGGPACLQSPSELKFADRFLQLLDQIDQGHDSATTIDAIHLGVAGLFAPANHEANGLLQIMTIHQSKGLEFDVVIIPSLHRSSKNSDAELFLWQERLSSHGNEELLMAAMTAKSGDKNSIYDYLHQEKKKRERFELCRLLYVACTRSKRYLHLLARVEKDESNTLGYRPPAKSSLLHTIWNSVQTSMKVISQPIQNHNLPMKAGHNLLYRLPSEWQFPNTLIQPLTDGIKFNTKSNENSPQSPSFWQDYSARHIGTLVHQMLHDMALQGIAHWKTATIDSHLPAWTIELAQLGVTKQHLNAAVMKIKNAALAILTDKNIAWLYASTHLQVHSEFSVSLKKGNRCAQLVIDLLLLTNDQQTWIIDFKTSQPNDDESNDCFIAKELKHYQSKMSDYAQAIHQLNYPSIRCALYFPLIAQWGLYPVENIKTPNLQ